MTVTSQQRKRKAVVPPKKITKGMTLYEYLSQCEPPLDRKLIEIACVQTGVPMDLRNDAAQEILVMWTMTLPDTKAFKPGQVASYAHRIARHACLRARRELGSSVRLPGSAFRKKKDGSSYITPGVLAAPLNWDDLESWYQTEGQDERDSALQNLFSQAESVMATSGPDAASAENEEDEALRRERLQRLEDARPRMSKQQYEIMRALIDGDDYETIMARQDIKRGVLLREIGVCATAIDLHVPV
jgi:DNA-directed RNA polymerase specialized sigma24 family protein